MQFEPWSLQGARVEPTAAKYAWPCTCTLTHMHRNTQMFKKKKKKVLSFLVYTAVKTAFLH